MLAGLLLGGCSGAPKEAAPAEETPTATPTVTVSVTHARVGPIETFASAMGTIYPRTQASVSSKLSSPILQLALLKNHRVEQGQVIAVLETRDLEAQRAEAVAALNEAELAARGLSAGTIPLANDQASRDLADARSNEAAARALYERRRGLYKQGGLALRDLESSRLALVTAEHGLKLTQDTQSLRRSAIIPSDRAQAQAKVQSARERIATLETQIGYATVRAPISGTVTEQVAFRGEFLAAGAKILTITDLYQLIVKAPFPDDVAAALHVGDPAEVDPSDRPGRKLHARVSVISATSDPTNRSVEVWVPVLNPDGRLRSGGSAQVTLPVRRHDRAVLIPRAAVTFDPSLPHDGKVMVVDAQGAAHERSVHTGLATPSTVEVMTGLKDGETVVKAGNFALPDGTRVVTH